MELIGAVWVSTPKTTVLLSEFYEMGEKSVGGHW